MKTDGWMDKVITIGPLLTLSGGALINLTLFLEKWKGAFIRAGASIRINMVGE